VEGCSEKGTWIGRFIGRSISAHVEEFENVATTRPSAPTLAFQKATTVVQSYVNIPLNELQPLKINIAHTPVKHPPSYLNPQNEQVRS
jgi:hypothetical protein